MESLDYLIIFLFVIVIAIKYYEYTAGKKEHYTTLWTPFSTANTPLDNTQCTAMNIKPNNKPMTKNYGNFGIIGKFPAIPICDSCHLDFDCVNYDWTDTDDRNANVCRKCKKNVLYKNYNDLSEPLYVYARSVGRPRQSRKIN
ncbi:unnamed protein product [marine sediment metagenome]|uniref:Uncharacterized protein n=1 Tax=marine sediment metagenome TaxID=412755 RepID=X1RQ55_9ZZZZ